jgi:hypothetical protein
MLIVKPHAFLFQITDIGQKRCRMVYDIFRKTKTQKTTKTILTDLKQSTKKVYNINK